MVKFVRRFHEEILPALDRPVLRCCLTPLPDLLLACLRRALILSILRLTALQSQRLRQQFDHLFGKSFYLCLIRELRLQLLHLSAQMRLAILHPAPHPVVSGIALNDQYPGNFS